MGARQKLNQAFFNGSLLFAIVAGAITQSWAVFAITGLVSLCVNLHSGGIRPGRRGR
jgi:hypothetical protein